MKKRPEGRYQKRIPYRKNGLLRYRYVVVVYGKSLQEVNRKEREVLKELDQVKSPAIETAVNDYLNHLSGSAPVNTYHAKLPKLLIRKALCCSALGNPLLAPVQRSTVFRSLRTAVLGIERAAPERVAFRGDRSHRMFNGREFNYGQAARTAVEDHPR